MKKLLIASLAILLVCGIALGATDVSGNWAGAPFYFIFKQDGTKLSGAGGPSEKEQLVSFDNGLVEGDRITFKAGSLQVNLRVDGDEMRGEMKNVEDTVKVYLKRVATQTNGAQSAAFDVASVKQLPPPPGGVRSSMTLTPGRITCSNVNLRKLIMAAYDVASSEKSVGHRYAPMGAGSSARASREPDVG